MFRWRRQQSSNNTLWKQGNGGHCDCIKWEAKLLQWKYVPVYTTPYSGWHPWLDETLIKDVGLENLGLCVHSGLKIFICMECEVAIIPESIIGHLKHQHKRELSRKSRSAIKATISGFVQRFDMPAKATEVVSPALGGPPVKGIKIEEGYQCTLRSLRYKGIVLMMSRHETP